MSFSADQLLLSYIVTLVTAIVAALAVFRRRILQICLPYYSGIAWTIFKWRIKPSCDALLEGESVMWRLTFSIRQHMESVKLFSSRRKDVDRLVMEAQALVDEYQRAFSQVHRLTHVIEECRLFTVTRLNADKIFSDNAYLEVFHPEGIRRIVTRESESPEYKREVHKVLRKNDPAKAVEQGFERLGEILLRNRTYVWHIAKPTSDGGVPPSEINAYLRDGLYIAGGILMIFGDLAGVLIRPHVEMLLGSVGGGLVALGRALR